MVEPRYVTATRDVPTATCIHLIMHVSSQHADVGSDLSRSQTMMHSRVLASITRSYHRPVVCTHLHAP
jgi:hypothetical protein